VNRFAGFDRGQRLIVLGLGLFAINRKPAGADQHFAGGLERLALDAGNPGGFEEFGRRVKHGEEAARYHVIELLLRLAQVFGSLRRGDDGKVIGNLGIIEDALVRPHPLLFQNGLGKRTIPGFPQHAKGAADRVEVILGQRARIGSRISEHLVPFVERLGQFQRVRGAEAEAAVGFTLQTRQIIE